MDSWLLLEPAVSLSAIAAYGSQGLLSAAWTVVRGRPAPMERRRAVDLKGTYDQIPARSSDLGEEGMERAKNERRRKEGTH